MIVGRAGEEPSSGGTSGRKADAVLCVIFVTKCEAQVRGWI